MVTGGLGQLGKVTVEQLVKSGHKVVIFDIVNKYNKKIAKNFENNEAVEILFGDITQPSTYSSIIPDLEAVIHMAAIFMPLSEENPELAEKINIEGTRNLVKMLEEKAPNCKFIFASSVSVFGDTADKTPPITVDDSIIPNNTYSNTKAKCEEIIKESQLNWLILRISAAIYLELSISKMKKLSYNLYNIPLENRVEFVHPLDVAVAFTNAVTTDVEKEIFIIGGGEKMQMLYREQLERLFSLFKLPLPKEKRFSQEPFPLDYYDTKRSQEILQFQSRTMDNYMEELKKYLGKKLSIIRFFSPIARLFI